MQLFSESVRKIMGSNLSKILAYGSYARGDYNENSDIDVMVLTSLPEDKIEPVEDALYDIAFDITPVTRVCVSVTCPKKKRAAS